MTSQTIWGSTDRGPAGGTMRFPVDINSSSGPGYLTVTELSVFMWASPTLVTPVLGVATATSINKLTLTQPATGSTLTIDDGFTVHATANATISGTNTGDQTDATLSFSDITTNNSGTSKHGFLKKLNNDATYYMDGTGNWSQPPSGGSGTVNSGTAGQMAYYATSTTAVSGNANATISNGALTLGVSTSVLGTLILSGNTSGAITIQPQAASGTWNFNLPVTAGTSGYVLTSAGGGSSPMTWTAAGTGTVTGPGSSTDTALVRWNGTGGTAVQNTGILVDGSNNVSAIGTLASGAHTVTSASATALTVGVNGATNPALKVDASAATSVTGWGIASTATGTAAALNVISSASNEDGKILAKGTGTLSLGASSTGTCVMSINGGARNTFANYYQTHTPTTNNSAAQARFLWTGAADTSLTTTVESPSVYFNIGQTRQHTAGAITLQRDFRVTGATHSGTASMTITDAAAFSVDGGPSAGTNVTITNSHGILIPTIALAGTPTNGFALTVNAPSGATNNYCAQFIGGNVGIGTAAPTAALHTSPVAAATGTLTAQRLTGAANTNQTLSTEVPDVDWNLARTVQWATGALATQRAVKIAAPTYGFVGASTITNAATVGITGAPVSGTNATLTNTHALLISAGAVTAGTNSYGLTVNTQTGATNNYCAAFLDGNTGFGTAAPTALIHAAAGTATAGTAPLKLTSGTNLTTAEAGAFEYNGTNLFFTRSGTTREGVLTGVTIATETVVSDTTLTLNFAGTSYKILLKA